MDPLFFAFGVGIIAILVAFVGKIALKITLNVIGIASLNLDLAV